MGFSVGSNGQWVQSFNWKPGSASQKTGSFSNQYTISDFIASYKIAENDKPAYSSDKNYIQKMQWDTENWHSGAVQLSNSGGTFDASWNSKSIYNVFGGTGVDIITGGILGDFIQGGGGNDLLNGFDGNDELWGGAGNDEIHGGEGRDALYGNDGNDKLYGDNGDDLLIGGAGDDTLAGGDGDDVLVGGAGTNILDGGAGKDTYYLSSLSSNDKILNFEEDDTIYLIGAEKDDIGLSTNNERQTEIRINGHLVATVDAELLSEDIGKRIKFGKSQYENY